jgi:transposase
VPSMQLRRDDVIVGVDTHKDEHVAVLLDGLGGRLAELFLPATITGFGALLSFCRDHVGPEGTIIAFGVEGTGSYGIGLARFLRRHGLIVQEVHRPPRKGERRLSGKSDTIDAEHAARQVLSGARMAQPKTADGQIEALRLIKIARDTAVKARTTAMITLKATLVTAGDELRAELEPLTDFKLVAACAELESATSLGDPGRGDAPRPGLVGPTLVGLARGDQDPQPTPQEADQGGGSAAGASGRRRTRHRSRAARDRR